ncbi:unnamed protein product [Ambrosiozyma monospora]|uniref:Unnamed protein product n=1 Tax=Ambrosiozyma monospora TaxID=43982 RepID=A0ACB5SV85_AMBMO|nr:unnamed protein product [Ambrosiozyma monospora]
MNSYLPDFEHYNNNATGNNSQMPSPTASNISTSKPHLRSSASYSNDLHFTAFPRDLEKQALSTNDFDEEEDDKKKISHTHVLLNNILLAILLVLGLVCIGLGLRQYSQEKAAAPPQVGLGLSDGLYESNLVGVDYFANEKKSQYVLSTQVQQELQNGVEQSKQFDNMNSKIDAKLAKLKDNLEANQQLPALTEPEILRCKNELQSILSISKIALVADGSEESYVKSLRFISEEPIMFNLKKHPNYEHLKSYIKSLYSLPNTRIDFPLLFVNNKLVLRGNSLKSYTPSEIQTVVHKYL